MRKNCSAVHTIQSSIVLFVELTIYQDLEAFKPRIEYKALSTFGGRT